MGMRIGRTQIVAAALLLAGCATPGPRPGAYEDILAIGATYPAGKLPIARINRLFGRDPNATIEVAVGHRETRTEMEITHHSIQLAYPEDYRCTWDFDDAPARFNEFMECVTRSRNAIFGVIVGEVVSDAITLHTILGFHVHPRHEEQGYATVMAIAGAYPAGELPTDRINRAFGREPDAVVRITLNHRTTRTRDETSDATMGHHGSLEPRCTLFYYDPPDKLADFLECAGSWRDAVLEVMVEAYVLEGVELHRVMGFHVHPRDEGGREAVR